MNAGWKILAALLLTAAGTVAGYIHGAHHEQLKADAAASRVQLQHTTELGAIDRASSTALQAATDRARAAETKAATDMAALDLKHTRELNDARKQAAADVAAVRTGAWRVRDEFTCASPVGAGGDVPQASAGTGVGDGTARRGLGPEDAAEILDAADTGDRWAIQLRACQAIVRQDRAGASGAPQP